MDTLKIADDLRKPLDEYVCAALRAHFGGEVQNPLVPPEVYGRRQLGQDHPVRATLFFRGVKDADDDSVSRHVCLDHLPRKGDEVSFNPSSLEDDAVRLNALWVVSAVVHTCRTRYLGDLNGHPVGVTTQEAVEITVRRPYWRSWYWQIPVWRVHRLFRRMLSWRRRTPVEA